MSELSGLTIISIFQRATIDVRLEMKDETGNLFTLQSIQVILSDG